MYYISIDRVQGFFLSFCLFFTFEYINRVIYAKAWEIILIKYRNANLIVSFFKLSRRS